MEKKQKAPSKAERKAAQKAAGKQQKIEGENELPRRRRNKLSRIQGQSYRAERKVKPERKEKSSKRQREPNME